MTDGYNARVSAEVRAEMARQRRSQQSLAGKLGWTQPFLSRRLNGQVDWATGEIEALAAELAVPISQLTQPPGKATAGAS